MSRMPLVAVAACALLLAACGPSEQQKAEWAERKRVECLDKVCEGDVVPMHEPLREFTFKVNGKWFVGPREYGGYGGTLAFFWPSKTPANRHEAPKWAPEFRPSAAGANSNFYDVGVELFLRTHDGRLHGPGRLKSLEEAQAEGRVLKKAIPRSGLEVWYLKDKDSSRSSVWYVATGLRGTDGQPPVLGCDAHDPEFDRCTSAFVWLPGVAVDMRFRAKHGLQWPEIYEEAMHVLQKLRKE